jgi:hypothetical protein
MSKGIKPTRWNIDLARAYVRATHLLNGAVLFALYLHDYPTPVGLVWGMARGKDFYVYHSYVMPQVRRMGVRTKINEAILQYHEVITTQSGSDDGGMAFLKSQGYKRNETLGCWYLTRPKKKKGKK